MSRFQYQQIDDDIYVYSLNLLDRPKSFYFLLQYYITTMKIELRAYNLLTSESPTLANLGTDPNMTMSL